MTLLQNFHRVLRSARIHENKINEIDEEVAARLQESSKNAESKLLPMLGDLCVEMEVVMEEEFGHRGNDYAESEDEYEEEEVENAQNDGRHHRGNMYVTSSIRRGLAS